MIRILRIIGCSFVAVALMPVVLPAQDELPQANGAVLASNQVDDQPAPDKPADRVAPDNAAAAAPTPPTLADVVEKLSAGNRKKFGEMLAADWPQRPEWADMLIALLQGSGMGPGAGWFKPSVKKYDWKWLAEHFDADGSGTISPEELPADAAFAKLLFARLDRDNDRQLRPSDFDHFTRQENTPALFMTQFLASLFDTDSNGRITREELEAFLKRADADKTGFLTADDLYRDFSDVFFEQENGGAGGSDMPRPEKMLSLFFRGDFGVFEAGPALGESAPDFTLPTHDGARQVTLSQSRGKPVILIFGSFTCGVHRSQAGLLDKLYARYKSEVDIYSIYIREAHPTDGWKMSYNDRLGVNFAQPATQEARNLVASECCQSLGLTMPLLVDTIDDRVNRAYCGFPIRLYLIDREGKVVYKGGRGPYGYRPRELEQSLLMLLLDEKLAGKPPAAAEVQPTDSPK